MDEDRHKELIEMREHHGTKLEPQQNMPPQTAEYASTNSSDSLTITSIKQNVVYNYL